MSPIFSGLGALAASLGTAVTAGTVTGVAAGAIGAGLLGAGTGLLASDIANLVEGTYPWSDPGEFFGEGAKASAMSGATAAAGSAIGPALGAAGEALGIGSNAGTIPAAAGAPSGAATATGNLAKEATSLLSSGANVTDAGFTSAIEKAIPNVAKGTLQSAATGALGNPDDPMKGAAMGAASGIATGVFNLGTDAAFRGMDNGFWSPAPQAEAQFRMQTPGPQDYSLLRTPPTGPQASMSMYQPQAQLGGRMLGGAGRVGSSLAGSAARMGVDSAMTPEPTMAPQSPFPGVTPYWMRPPFQ